MFLAVLPACPQLPPFYNWLPNDPQFSGFFTPMTLLLLHLVRNGLVFTRVVYWITPYFGEYTFYLIGPYFWLGVGTYLSLQIGLGSAPPRWLVSIPWIIPQLMSDYRSLEHHHDSVSSHSFNCRNFFQNGVNALSNKKVTGYSSVSVSFHVRYFEVVYAAKS